VPLQQLKRDTAEAASQAMRVKPAPFAYTGEGNVNGFGLEFYIETPADEVSETIHDIKQSWQFQLLYTVSQLAAGGCACTAQMLRMASIQCQQSCRGGTPCMRRSE
jgi:hypothetical protein